MRSVTTYAMCFKTLHPSLFYFNCILAMIFNPPEGFFVEFKTLETYIVETTVTFHKNNSGTKFGSVPSLLCGKFLVNAIMNVEVNKKSSKQI